MNEFGNWVIVTPKTPPVAYPDYKIAINLAHVACIQPLAQGSQINWASNLHGTELDVHEEVHEIFRRGVV